GVGTWRASAGRGFRAPTLAERYVTTRAFGFEVIPNPDLDPEAARSFELGNGAPIASWGRLDAALFWTEARRLLEQTFVRDPRVPARVLDLHASWQRGPLSARLLVANALNYSYNLVPRTVEPVRTASVVLTCTY